MLKLLLLVSILFFLYTIYDIKELFTFRKKRQFKPSIPINDAMFMKRKETQEFLRKDEDNFVNNLNTINKKARGVNNIFVYYDLIEEAAMDFEGPDKELLQKAMNRAEELLLKAPTKLLNDHGIDRERLKLIRDVRLALTRGRVYENGFPHTRGNIILLSTDYLDKNRDDPAKVLNTIIHEMVHIYQRNNGKIYDGFLKKNFWSIVRAPKDTERRRMNPDLDMDIWEKDGRVYMAKFKSDHPESLDDVDIKGESIYEHPYEYYAYRFSNEITK
jgi:hypothetical protein